MPEIAAEISSEAIFQKQAFPSQFLAELQNFIFLFVLFTSQ